MTINEALDLIQTSAPWTNAKGDPVKAWRLWNASNPGEATKLLAYASGGLSPSLQTKYGRGMVDLVGRGLFALIPTAVREVEPAPTPTPSPSRPAVNGAVLDDARNMNVELLRAANVRWVCVDLRDIESLADFAFRGPGQRWAGFERYGGFYVSHGEPVGNEGERIAELLEQHNLESLVVVDTESHKADLPDGVIKPERLEWTDRLYDQLGAALPSAVVFCANVTFGRNASPQVVNLTRLRQPPLDSSTRETYDGDGITQGVREAVAQVNAEGDNPADIMLGTKSLDVEIPLANEERRAGRVRDIWLWAPDHGPAQDSLARGLRLS